MSTDFFHDANTKQKLSRTLTTWNNGTSDTACWNLQSWLLRRTARLHPARCSRRFLDSFNLTTLEVTDAQQSSETTAPDCDVVLVPLSQSWNVLNIGCVLSDREDLHLAVETLKMDIIKITVEGLHYISRAPQRRQLPDAAQWNCWGSLLLYPF